MLRRRVVNWLLGTSSGALFAWILYPVLRFLSPPSISQATTNQVEAGPSNDPELLDNGFKIVRFGSDPVLLVRVSEGDFRAYSAVCTHLDCIVEFQRDRRLIWCNCHNGSYDLSGRNIGGPPPRPLRTYKVDLVHRPGQADMIIVSRT